MKKTIIGIFAAVLAIGFSAFTAPAKKATLNYFFAFDYANFSPTQANVESDLAWVESTSTPCATTNNQIACKIEVDASDTHLDGAVRKLNSGINIVAAQYLSTGDYRVSGGTDVITAMNQKR